MSSVRRFLRSKLYYGRLLLPRMRAKHRKLLASADRSDSYTYTWFHRSPAQLDALTGPVIDHVVSLGGAPVSINVFAGSNGSEAYTIASRLMARRPDLDFSIKASDLQAEMVERATAAVYTLDEITQGLEVPEAFLERTFEKVGNLYAVKADIRSRVTFVQASLLEQQQLDQQFEQADVVFAQNVLFHMPPHLARQAFANIVRFLKPRSALFLDGMELDMRVELTKAADLRPLRFKIKEIYEYSRRQVPDDWWRYYYGTEPFSRFSRQATRRYATIFLKG